MAQRNLELSSVEARGDPAHLTGEHHHSDGRLLAGVRHTPAHGADCRTRRAGSLRTL